MDQTFYTPIFKTRMDYGPPVFLLTVCALAKKNAFENHFIFGHNVYLDISAD